VLILIVCGLLIAIGLVGVVVPGLPGTLLVVLSVLLWAAVEEPSRTGWTVLTVAVALAALGAVIKYLVPGRRLKAAGVPMRTIILGAVLGIVGFFVIPVIGLPIGFVAGIYVAERARLGKARAWPATRSALGAVGLSILIEFTFAFLAAVTWVVGVLVTR
jgi:uncharacterized protein